MKGIRTNRRRERGTLYIEVLIAAAILGILLVSAGSAVLNLSRTQALNVRAVAMNRVAAQIAGRLAGSKVSGVQIGTATVTPDGLIVTRNQDTKDGSDTGGGKGGKKPLPGPSETPQGLLVYFRAEEIPLQSGQHYVGVSVYDGKNYVTAGTYYRN